MSDFLREVRQTIIFVPVKKLSTTKLFVIYSFFRSSTLLDHRKLHSLIFVVALAHREKNSNAPLLF